MRILVLCTFPADIPRHGGQIRLRNIIDKYRALGHEVVSAGVLGSGSYPQSEYYIEFPKRKIKSVLKQTFCMEDYAIGKLMSTDELWYFKLVKKIPWVPDVIHVELPWLFEFAERYVKDKGIDIPIIYGSENIEYKLKYSILSNFMSPSDAKCRAELVREVELNAIEKSSCCIAVSENDFRWLKEKSSVPVFLAPNGVASREVTIQGESKFNKLKLPSKYALYCASAHLPNVTGFYDIFEPGLACIEPDQMLVVVGSCGALISNDKRFEKTPCLSRRTLLLDEVPDDLLASLLYHAHCILLPITSGGGTNLKTAEAIWIGSHIVGTQIAFRGFEEFQSSQGVKVAKTPMEFRQLVRSAMSCNRNICNAEDRKLRHKVLWTESLHSLDECLNLFRG